MRVFLYADNLNLSQLARRAPEHKFVCLAYLPDHTIQFCRWSTQWRCGLASAVPSPGERVWGILADVTDEDMKLLDAFEQDVPDGAFRHVQMTVMTDQGEKVLATAHIANPIGKFKPKQHYLDFVLKGAAHWKLPAEAVETWKSYKTI